VATEGVWECRHKLLYFKNIDVMLNTFLAKSSLNFEHNHEDHVYIVHYGVCLYIVAPFILIVLASIIKRLGKLCYFEKSGELNLAFMLIEATVSDD
jgi:hypothetical protein